MVTKITVAIGITPVGLNAIIAALALNVLAMHPAIRSL
jgi:hypothetical protein